MIRTSDTEGTYWSSDSERTQGFKAAMAEAGLPVEPDYVVVEPYAIDSGKRAMRRLLRLETPPTAVFAYSDELAIGALRALQEEGIGVPGQVSLVGVDGHPTAALFGITSVDQAVATQGRLAGRLVLDLLGRTAPGPRAISAEFRLEVRTTTGPPPAKDPSPRRRRQRASTPAQH
jgi:LacI family transcriptional regulator, repressor for deo operon, udp, cdd, tsx, nupC, and nupG